MPDDSNASPSQTAALLTPRGRGAVATIRFHGTSDLIASDGRSLFRAANGRAFADQPIGRIVFGRWGYDAVEDVVVCKRDMSTVDIHCHGGQAAVARILDDLASLGCRVIEATEQTTMDRGILAAECLDALSRATTLRAADVLLDQCSGTLSAAIKRLSVSPPHRQGELGGAAQQKWSALAVERDPPCPPLLRGGGGDAPETSFRKVETAIRALLEWANFGLHLTAPWKVVVTGRPNVGKSSLINALLGYARSIVYDQPGTTRDVVTAETAIQGWPVQLADTAGMRVASDEIETAGIAMAQHHLKRADCRVIVLDISRAVDNLDLWSLKEWPDAIVVAHKSDLPDVWGSRMPLDAIRVSSLTGAGVDTLADAIAIRLVPRVPAQGTPIPITERQVNLLRQAQTTLAAGDYEECSRCLGELQ